MKYCFQDVKCQKEFRRVPECRILHHLPQTPGRTATAQSAVGHPLCGLKGHFLLWSATT